MSDPGSSGTANVASPALDPIVSTTGQVIQSRAGIMCETERELIKYSEATLRLGVLPLHHHMFACLKVIKNYKKRPQPNNTCICHSF